MSNIVASKESEAYNEIGYGHFCDFGNRIAYWNKNSLRVVHNNELCISSDPAPSDCRIYDENKHYSAVAAFLDCYEQFGFYEKPKPVLTCDLSEDAFSLLAPPGYKSISSPVEPTRVEGFMERDGSIVKV